MPHELHQEECDLTQYPHIVSPLIRDMIDGEKKIIDEHDNDEITAGDLHGNALYLLHFLIKYRVVELDKKSYQQFVKIYQKPASEMTKVDFQAFDNLLRKAKVNNNKKVRLLGDILADRGKNDYFTLKLIELLDKGGADLSILLSNHDAEFMLNFELNGGLRPPFHEKMMHRDFTKSMEGLVNSIGKGDLDQAHCETLYRKHFLPHVKAMDYCFESAGESARPQLYTHAPVDLNLMGKAAAELGLPFDNSTDDNLKASIDAVNKKIQEILVSGQFHLVFEEMVTVDYETRQQVIAFFDWSNFTGEKTNAAINASIQALTGEDKRRFAEKFPSIARRGHVGIDIATKQARALTRLLWNRDFSDLVLDQSQHYWFIHGHDSQIVDGNMWTLDGVLGKGDAYMKGAMPVVTTKYDLGKYYQFVRYEIEERDGQRVLILELVDKRTRFYSADMDDRICVAVDKGLGTKDVIARLNAMFTHEGSEKRLQKDKKAIRRELGLVMSWPRPEGVSCEEIYQRLRQVYAVESKPSHREIARVFSFNSVTSIDCSVKMEKGQRVLHVKEFERDNETGRSKVEDEFDISFPDDVRSASIEEKLKPLYTGQRLKPTAASLATQFSSVFNKVKPKGTRVKGKVEMKTESLVQEELEPCPFKR